MLTCSRFETCVDLHRCQGKLQKMVSPALFEPCIDSHGCQGIDFLLNCLSAFETRLDLHGCHGQQVINSLSESLRPVLIYAELIIDR